jgi:hypothetical protein
MRKATGGGSSHSIDHLQQPQNHALATFDGARFQYFKNWQHSVGTDNETFCVFRLVKHIKLVLSVSSKYSWT